MSHKHMRTVIFAILISVFSGTMYSQGDSFPKPRNERLLNDMNLLIWKQPAAEKLTIRLRVHSGAAFDPFGKEGTARLLTRVMLPDAGIFEDFADDLGGSLKVTATHDYLQIDMISSPEKLVEVLQILAGAVVTPQINRETTAEAKKAAMAELAEMSADPEYLAYEAGAERLYGSFPYGRPVIGTEESLERIDFADLLFAQERFLTADNATLTISGNVDTSFAYRAARRLLGGWQKGKGRVPPNFTVPETPDTAQLVVNTDFGTGVVERFAIDAISRRDPDYFVGRILVRLLNKQLESYPISPGARAEVVFTSNYLKGNMALFLSRSQDAPPPPNFDSRSPKPEYPNPLVELLSAKTDKNEFELAKANEIMAFRSSGITDHWFDIDTYGLKSVEDEYKKLRAVTFEDLNRLAKSLAKRPVVDVTVMPLDAPPQASDKDPNDPR